MANGHDERISKVGLDNSVCSPENDVKDDSLLKVIKAVEAAETTIKQQVEENGRLKAELERSILELAKYKSDEYLPQTSNRGDHSDTTAVSHLGHQPVDWKQNVIYGLDDVSSHMLVVHPHADANGTEGIVSNRFKSPSQENMGNGIVNGAIGGSGLSQFYSSSPMRVRSEGAHVAHIDSSTHEFIPVGEVNNSGNAWKQDLIHKVQEHEQEILQLRRYLADCSIKEAQIRNEKYVLEKRIAYMRLAFDQEQQELVDAESKALSYRQEIIEENIRLTYALQATQQERSTFVSYLLPLLLEYSLQPQVSDAQSIVSNVKVLFKHLQEKLLLTETRLKESEYQSAPWRSETDHSIDSPLAPSLAAGVALTHSTQNSLYTHDHTSIDWDSERPHLEKPGGSAVRKYHIDGPISQSTPLKMSVKPGTSKDESHGQKHETVMKDDDADAEGQPDAKIPLYDPASDGPSSSNSLLLSTVREEPSSSSSEGDDDDPLPGIEDLQISGEPYPGHELQACGYSINGTTSCNFEWVCHLEDGSVNYIDGAKQPNYLVTADDVGLYLAIEVQPLDDRNRKGELVKVFANENRKIACHPKMQSHIEKTLHSGHASYKVSVATGMLDIWEEATLSIKREGYNIKCNNDLIAAEKFSASTAVTIPFGQPAEFVLIGSDGSEHSLRTDNGSTDLSGSRDEIVLILRFFIMRTSASKGAPGGSAVRNYHLDGSTDIKTVMEDAEGQSDMKNPPHNMFRLVSTGDDPLPGVEDLQIIGEPYPGHELQACGYSVNGTTSCNFEWVCRLEDGSVNYIDGAKQPKYLVTADDVDSYLALEVQPLDDRNRKGEIVKVSANENRKIVCHPQMQSHIEKTIQSGHASYKVSVATDLLDGLWEEATLSIEREGYNIICNNDLVAAENFSASTAVKIPFGQPAEFVIIGSDGSEHSLRADKRSTDLSGSRDEIVLILRSFIMAGSAGKGVWVCGIRL